MPLDHGVRKVQLLQLGNAVFPGALRTIHEVGNDEKLFIVQVHVGTRVDVGRHEFLRPSVNLAIAYGIHERGLSDPVLSDQRVTVCR
jgi:hypothetical protein